MHSTHWSVRVTIGLILMLGLVAMSAFSRPSSVSAAANTAKITLHVIECPAGTANLFASCHDTHRLAGASFTVTGVTRASDANGVVSWGPSAGTRTIRMAAADFSGNAWVYCKDQTDGDVLFDGRTTTGNVTITTTAQHLTICDWYNIV